MPVPSGKDIGPGEGLSARLVSPEEVESRPARRIPYSQPRQFPIPAKRAAPSLPPAPLPLPSDKASSPPPVFPPVAPKPAAPAPQPLRENAEKSFKGSEQQPHYEAKNLQGEKNGTVPPVLPPQPKVNEERAVGEAQTPSPAQRKTKESTESIPKPVQRAPSLKEKLFDKGVISDLAKRDIEKKDRENKTQIPLRDTNREHAYNFGGPLRNRDDKKFDTDKKLAFDEKELKFMLYNMKLKDRLEHIWIYPPSAAARGISGDLIIRFSILKNGKLGAVELVRTSGHKDLDDAAVRALREGSPYWPLPESWGMDSYTIDGHFIYTIIYNL
jgi:periplasmic protein TonB